MIFRGIEAVAYRPDAVLGRLGRGWPDSGSAVRAGCGRLVLA
jgi:hypothetical protein